jgi:Putative zinc-finger/Predicted integral membrane protein (DUF2275)
MNCEEVQAQLSDYLEKALPTADLKIIEAHLSACALCRMETDYLSECIHQVASLPIVDPPIGFTQRVMACVRETNEKPSFWERWLFPLRIKIPLQATAVLVVGILAVYLLEKEPPEKRPLMTSETIVPENQFGRMEKNQETPISKTESQQAPAKSQTPASSAPVSKTSQTKTARGANEKILLSRAKSLAEERSDTSSPSSPTEAKGPGTGIVSGTPIKSSGQFPEPVEFKSGSLRPEAITVEPFADYETVFRLQSSTQQQPRRDNAGLSQKPAVVVGRQATGGDLDRLLEVVAGSAQPQTVWLNVSKSQYEQLKKALRAMGTIESETQVPLLTGEPGDQNNGQLQIKLTVLPAPETNRATPSGDK